MTRQLTQFRVFIGSPSGLEEERRAFQKALAKFTECHAEPRDVVFKPVGWEDTLPGNGRPQELINQDLKPCDYAVFVFHDRWGSDAGKSGKVGTEEEFDLAEQLYAENTLRTIVLLFKTVDGRQMKDPGPQLQKVLAFKKTIEEGKRYLCKPFDGLDQFTEIVDACLSRWLRDHETKASLSVDGSTARAATPATVPAAGSPGWAFWVAEAKRAEAAPEPDHAAALFCRARARDAASTDAEWVEAENGRGAALYGLGRVPEALAALEAVHDRVVASKARDLAHWSAKALFNKGVALGTLGRSDEAIAAYDEVVARFAAATEPGLREQVASALVNKGAVLGTLGRSDEAITACDEVVARFAAATEPGIREPVARALFTKALTLRDLGRSDDAIAVLETCIARSGGTSDSPERISVDASRRLLAELRAKPKRRR